MRKKILLVAIFVSMFLLCTGFKKSDIDLSKLSYDELVELKDQINLAMWKSEDWEEVTVPQGLWVVGKDIPKGHWTVKCNKNGYACWVAWGTKLENDHKVNTSSGGCCALRNPDNKNYNGETAEIDLKLVNGMYVEIGTSYDSAVFSPYSGKQSLGFKELQKE